MLAESPQTFNINKENTEQLIHDTHCVSVRLTQHWALCGRRLCAVKQGASRQRALKGSESGLYCEHD